MKPLVSIIIPAYNCSQYIDKCIESILIQTYKNIEIIIINDGSLDNTEIVIKKYINKDKRIKYFSQKNLGPSIARNNGIEKASGKYLMFVDSDDIVSSIYVEKLLDKIESINCDIVCCGYIDESKYGIFKLNDFWINKEKLNKEEFIRCTCRGVGGVLWAKIFRRDIIIDNNIRMNSKIFMSEDLLFILEYCKYSKNFIVLNENLYYYNRFNESSISSNISIGYLENYNLLIREIKFLLNKLNIDNYEINSIVVLKIQGLVNNVLKSESNKYLIFNDKCEVIRNFESLLNCEFIKEYKSKFINNTTLDRITNTLINKNKYISLLYLNIIIIKLKKLKDKILRR